MKLTAAQVLFKKHNNGEIHIQTILSDNRVLLDNIVANSSLDYNQEKHTLTYINEDGLVNTLVNVNIIDQILYVNLETTNNDNESNCNCDCGCNGNCDVCIDEDCSCNTNINHDTNYNFPDSEIISNGYIKNGMIYPTELADGTLIYDCTMGNIKKYVCHKTAGIVKTDNNTFSKHFGNGYVLLNYGQLEMNIFVPYNSLYSISVRAGSENNAGKRGSLFINNVERFVRTSANQKGIWEIVNPEKYCEEEDYFLEVDSTQLSSGINKFILRVDQARGTINNAYNCLILKRDSAKSEDNPGCSEYFHISERQYAQLKKSIEDLNKSTISLEENMKRTFITLDTVKDLFNIPSSELVNGRMFKVNDVGNGNSGYYYFNQTTNSWIKFDFNDPKTFITLNTYADLKEFTLNKDNLVHGKLAKINRPSVDDLDPSIIEEPDDYYKPAYYAYDSIGNKWIKVKFGASSSSSTNIEEVKDLIEEHNNDATAHSKIIENHNSDIDAHPNTFITVNSLQERDTIKKINGRIVRVNNTVDDEDETKNPTYYRWDARNKVWVTENIFNSGEGNFTEDTVVQVDQIEGLEDTIKSYQTWTIL